jgi:hypothetical protein
MPATAKVDDMTEYPVPDIFAPDDRRDAREALEAVRKILVGGGLIAEHLVPDNFKDERRDTREALVAVGKLLAAGAEGPGTMRPLTADECAKVLSYMKNPSSPKGRPPKDRLEMVLMAIYCRALEEGGASKKSAVERTAQLWGCKRSTVFAALKYFPSQ